jgi:Tol biopolymer transport system component/serine/threonine protein kinase
VILERGALLNGRYRIVEILGQGGMGSVYRAVDENLGVEVAVKDNMFSSDDYARQFRREAILLANLRHPNLPRVTDHFIIEGQGQYLVMDYIEGEDLRQRMERVGVLPEEEVCLIGAAVCDALSYLGGRKPPIIHRDIKPGNVKITPQGQIYLVDFGLAKTLLGSQATTTGARAMTPGYSPPEQYGTARTDQRSDVFSLGATLYAALTGATPEDALARAMDQGELTPIRKYNPRVSRRMAAVIEKALEVRPDDRFQTADEFKAALLGVSNLARRREGGYSVEPPPEEEKPLPADSALLPPETPLRLVSPAGKPPSILPISTPFEEQQEAPRGKAASRKRKKRSGCLVYLMLLVALLIAVSLFIYRFDPGMPARAYGLYWPTLSAYFPSGAQAVGVASTLESTSTPTLTLQPPTATMTLLMLVDDSPTATLSPSETPEPTITPTDTPTPLPTRTGGGAGQIAFASKASGNFQIYVINSDGTGRRQITNLPEGACQPDWSPDGKRLVFISPCETINDYYPGSAMYIINEDGKGLLPLPTLVGGDYDPKWSPDGNKIVFTSLRNGGRPQLFVHNLEDNSVTPISEKFLTDFQASWSPDGKQLVFISTRKQGQQVWVMDADGKNPQQLTRKNNGILNYRPSYSPDGKNIIFTQYVSEGSVPRVLIAPINFETYSDYRVSDLPMRDAVYSPDGYWIAFEGWLVGGSHNIYIMSATGAGLTPVTDDSALDFDPAWRPAP